MAKGITITVDCNVSEVREPRKGDVCVKMTGTQWVYLDWSPIHPRMHEVAKIKPYVKRTPIEFLPPDVVPHDRLLYLREYLPKIRRAGIVR